MIRLLVLLGAVGWFSCHRQETLRGDTTDNARLSIEAITRFLERGDCRGATSYLNHLQQAARTVQWYDYMSQARLVCGEASLDTKEELAALAVLDDGLGHFPKSSRLRQAKAELYESLGDLESAKRFYVAAREVAERNRQQGHASPDDEAVLAELGNGRYPHRHVPARPIDTSAPPILIDTSAHWSARVPELVASGRCAEAIKLLTSVAAEAPLWYELSAQSNAACFVETAVPKYRDEALAAVERGITKFPASIRLRLTRALVVELTSGESAAARYYRETATLAQANITAQSAEADESRRVLQEMQRAQKLDSVRP